MATLVLNGFRCNFPKIIEKSGCPDYLFTSVCTRDLLRNLSSNTMIEILAKLVKKIFPLTIFTKVAIIDL